jgi:hypothetical protein
VTRACRDAPRRVTPELIALHTRRAKQLRDEACRDMARAMWGWVMKIIRQR